MRRRPRIDGNHRAVISALRAIGCSVLSLAQLGDGVPDILCARNGQAALIEIKDGSKPPSARRLTTDEELFLLAWRGKKAVVTSVSEAVDYVQREMDPR